MIYMYSIVITKWFPQKSMRFMRGEEQWTLRVLSEYIGKEVILLRNFLIQCSNIYNNIYLQKYHELCFGEIVIKVQMYCGQIVIFIHTKLIKVFKLICNSIFLQSFLHIEVHTFIFPGVAACVQVVVDITVLDLFEDFFWANLKWYVPDLLRRCFCWAGLYFGAWEQGFFNAIFCLNFVPLRFVLVMLKYWLF